MVALCAGKMVLIVAHGNSLGALVKHLEGVSDQAFADLNIPVGVRLVYELGSRLRTLNHYLDDPQEIAKSTAPVAGKNTEKNG